jgi:hypothetical protein
MPQAEKQQKQPKKCISEPRSVNMFSTFRTSSDPKSISPLMKQGLAADFAWPPASNEKNYLPFDQKDADDFSFEIETKKGAIDEGLPTRIVCQNPGTWEIINQYQVDCLKSGSKPEQLSGFATFGNIRDGDGKPIKNSSATCSVKEAGEKVVLVIAYTAKFKKGEYFKVGGVSSNAEVAICNSYPGVTGLVDPICITLCNKLN